MHGNPEWIIVGRVKRPHGKTGELLVESLTDNNDRFEAGSELYLAYPGEQEKRVARITASRRANLGIIIRLDGVGRRDEAKPYTGAEFFIPVDAIKPADNDSFYSFQVEGCRVYQGDDLVGSVTALVESRANPYLEVQDEGGTSVLIPFVKDVIRSIDVAAARIEINEGFLR